MLRVAERMQVSAPLMRHHAFSTKVQPLSSWLAAQPLSQAVAVPAAGRMQDNEPLMRALSSLIALNRPDLVLFVGEALVGNDAVDQLTKFNRRLTDLATDQARPLKLYNPNCALPGDQRPRCMTWLVHVELYISVFLLGVALHAGLPVASLGTCLLHWQPHSC